MESPHHGSWSGGCWGALQTLSGCRWGTVENETSSNQCQDAGRLQIMTSMGTDMESGTVTSDEHFGILCSIWLGLFSGKHWAVTERSSTLPRSHSLPHRRHLRQFNVCTFSIVKSSYKAYGPGSFFLLLLYTSVTQCIINHNRRQFNYNKVTEIRAPYPFCYQQPLSRRQKEQIRLLCC